MSFCGDANFRKKITDLLYSRLFDVPRGSTLTATNQMLEKRYEQMRCCLWLLYTRWQDIDPANTIVPCTKDVLLRMDGNQFAPSNNNCPLLAMPNYGLDLPVWIDEPLQKAGNPKNSDDSFGWDRKRVMIIAQDPLRKGMSGGALYLSTSFGMHSRDYRGNRLMTQIVNDLITSDREPVIYLTDFNKFFVEDGKHSLSLCGDKFLIP